MFSKKFAFLTKSNSDKHTQSLSSTAFPPSDTSLNSEADGPALQLLNSATATDGLAPQNSHLGSGPLGLNVVYTPNNGHKADIVFIHGLGGSSRWTWSKSHKAELFWPLTFLPLEPDVCLARILSFGYNADFRKSGNLGTMVLDFAKRLLYDLKYAKDEQKEDLNMGKVPLLFVVHSMGGLIIKEAYMQGQHDPNYEDIIRAISAITFLATPHRGTNLAKVLNRILDSSMMSNSKAYVTELSRNSFTLQKLNEQFRHIAPKLDIVSFYEMQPTPIGLKSARVLVLEKETSILGYPGETSTGMDADHHGVCKYESPRDPNYIMVRNVLKSLVSKIVSAGPSKKPVISQRKQSHDLKAMLAISELPDMDYIFFRDRWTLGTCEWIQETGPYLEWLDKGSAAHQHRLLWLHGGAGSGKSILSSFIINSLVEQGLCCQYFFIRFDDRNKRTLSFLLRSIAYQMAQRVPGFLQKVLELADEALDFETADPKLIWERIFRSVLFKMEGNMPLYWVIDGLDEADDPRAIIKLLCDITVSSTTIRILLVSRHNVEIAGALERVPNAVSRKVLSIEGQVGDLHCYIRHELCISGSTELRELVVERIVQESQNNFLWVRLALGELNSCRSHADVEKALRALPAGMEALYDRMALSSLDNASLSERSLVLAVLQCVTCSFRALTSAELFQILEEKLSGLFDFQQSILELCAGFLVIDNSGNIALIHQTAREYLINDGNRLLTINPGVAHEHLFLSCMRCLMSTGLRAKVSRNTRPEFLDYSVMWWHYHLIHMHPSSKQAFNVLNKFLMGQWVLTWIKTLATGNQLRILLQASTNLRQYASKQKLYGESHLETQLILKPAILESWATDLIKLVGKFGKNLQRNPEAIYKIIPPFCPRNSALYKQFGKAEERNLHVSGLLIQDWDDSLARITFGHGAFASSITAQGTHIAVLESLGNVFTYDSATFEEGAASPIKHGERVYRMVLNRTGVLLVTYGFKTTKVWEIATGICKLVVDNPDSRPRPLAMLLTPDNETLLVGADDKQVRSLSLNAATPTWQLVAELEEPELDGHNLNAASYMAMNNDGSLIVVAYRGHPLSAWEVDGPFHINHCWRARDEIARGEVIQVAWHPHIPEVLGLYIEGVVFKWNPYEGEPQELSTGAARLAMSNDGNLFATGDVHGTVKVYTTSHFSLLYQLSSPDTVRGMTFSPDSRRFYDVRGYYGNAWEPDVLMQYTEHLEKSTGMESDIRDLGSGSAMPKAASQTIDSVTVLASSPLGRFYCYGTEYGALKLFDVQHGRLPDIYISKSFLSIEQLIWSGNGRFICFSNSSKRVFIASVTQNGTVNPISVAIELEVSVKDNTKGPIVQLVFEPSAKYVFVHTSSTIATISLETSVVHTQDLLVDGYKWIIHPINHNQIVGIGPNAIKAFDWNLNEIAEYPFEYSDRGLSDARYAQQSASGTTKVLRILVTPDKTNVLVQISLGKPQNEAWYLYFPTSSFLATTPTTSKNEPAITLTSIKPDLLPEHVSSQVAYPLTILSRDRFIFLSKTFSVCKRAMLMRHHSHDGTLVDRTVEEIFTFPGDWTSKDCVAMCSIWSQERSLLCPKNGEVAVVRSSGLC
ncbi:NACHT and WD domain protein [Tothia fuscella]|uniref:NACHT and WD domain protein n=1 Tax=Tothia fuscella TaxID=1048955 RepID=A0A9P4U2N2_9PEZI|nr:NACHT and WD domain protein [Tothia fuscella]